jgi:hypothetical protein
LFLTLLLLFFLFFLALLLRYWIGIHAAWRNPIDEVAAMLEHYHADSYMIFNLRYVFNISWGSFLTLSSFNPLRPLTFFFHFSFSFLSFFFFHSSFILFLSFFFFHSCSDGILGLIDVEWWLQ